MGCGVVEDAAALAGSGEGVAGAGLSARTGYPIINAKEQAATMAANLSVALNLRTGIMKFAWNVQRANAYIFIYPSLVPFPIRFYDFLAA